MSFPRYLEYRDSGVEWLGEVPGHWDVLALKKSFQIIGGSTPKSDMESFWDGDILWATPSDLSKRDSVYMNDTQRKITAAGLASCGTTLVPARSIVLSTRAPIGSLAIADTEMCTNQGCKSLVPLENTSTEYFAYLLSISSTELNIHGKGTTFLELSGDELGAFKAPVPPLLEQTQIAAFLDRETAKIDALVAEQRRLMALLKEKRQAVISHAVTRGLNPNVPLKQSGIEWLGDVPEHWDVMVIKRFSTLHRGHDLTDAERTDGTYPVVTSSGINGTHGSFMAFGPGVVTGRYGSTGKLFYIEDNFWPHNTSLYVSNFHGNNVRFVWYSLQTVDFAAHSAKAAVPGIDRNDIHVLPVVVPPKDEQATIVAFLESELAKLDTLTTEAQLAIDLLQERRTALISAAVTGQIDVRCVLQ